jgi:tRNA(Ile)-lysidine synthase
VHINHGLSPNAARWQQHCQQVCLNLKVPIKTFAVEFDKTANIEEGARKARYAVFSSLLQTNDALVLAHHQDDQAETVLLQLFRGAGIDGLAAMSETKAFAGANLFRPLLNYSRLDLEEYAAVQGLQWIEDESNDSDMYSRNYIRKHILPLVIKQWPGAVANVARAALNCQQAKANLEALAVVDCPELASPQHVLGLVPTYVVGAVETLNTHPLKNLDPDRISNILRLWLKQNQLQAPSQALIQGIINEVLFARADATAVVTWSKIKVRRYQNHLYLEKEDAVAVPDLLTWTDFPQALMYPTGIISATKAKTGLKITANMRIEIRFRVGGEEFQWHGLTKKLKKLMQDWGIPPWQREKIPLLYLDNQLAAVIGYAIADNFYSEEEGLTLWQINSQAS